MSRRVRAATVTSAAERSATMAMTSAVTVATSAAKKSERPPVGGTPSRAPFPFDRTTTSDTIAPGGHAMLRTCLLVVATMAASFSMLPRYAHAGVACEGYENILFCGELNGDCQVSSTDALLALRMGVGL